MRMRIIALVGVLCWAAPAFSQIRGGIRTPDGKQVGMGQVTQDPKKIIEDRRRQFAATMRLAEENFREKHWQMARESAESAKHLITRQEDLQRVVDFLVKLQGEGNSQLKQAVGLYKEGRYDKYLRAVRRIRYQFGSLPCGKVAADLLAKAETDPKLRSGLQEVKAAALDEIIDKIIEAHFRAKAASEKGKADFSAPKPAKGKAGADEKARADDKGDEPAEKAKRPELIKKLPRTKQRRVLEMLERIAKVYPDSPTGMKAMEDLMVLRSDKAFSSKLAAAAADREVKRALNKARAYDKAGMRVKALNLYRQVVKDYPDTPQAKQAAEHIRDLQLGGVSSAP